MQFGPTIRIPDARTGSNSRSLLRASRLRNLGEARSDHHRAMHLRAGAVGNRASTTSAGTATSARSTGAPIAATFVTSQPHDLAPRPD